MTVNLIILAAGMSSRMKKSMDVALLSSEEEQANKRSKGLISLGASGRPLLDYILYNAQSAGITDVYLVTGAENSLFKDHYGSKSKNNEYNGLQLSYAVQHIPKDRDKPLGTADAVFQTLEQYPHLQSESFLVCNSDNLYSANAFRSLLNSEASNALIAYDIHGLEFDKDRLRAFAILELDTDENLVSIIEKPNEKELSDTRADTSDLHVSMNIFKFDGTQFYRYVRDCPLHSVRNEKELPVALLHMIAEHPASVRGLKLSEHVPDLTSKADIPLLKNRLKNFDFTHWL